VRYLPVVFTDELAIVKALGTEAFTGCTLASSSIIVSVELDLFVVYYL
jgi:hypothetical protein